MIKEKVRRQRSSFAFERNNRIHNLNYQSSEKLFSVDRTRKITIEGADTCNSLLNLHGILVTLTGLSITRPIKYLVVESSDENLIRILNGYSFDRKYSYLGNKVLKLLKSYKLYLAVTPEESKFMKSSRDYVKSWLIHSKLRRRK